jgi:phosphate transport system substrate-binding protein
MNTRALPLLLAAAACFSSISCVASGEEGITLQGAGATFPAPLYQRWFLEYYRRHPEVRVNYQPIGSGAGIRQFTEGLVDFGASDAAMSDKEMAKVKPGVRLLPMTAGSVVICYNVPGVQTQLKLTRKTYVDIFLGEITEWNDPAIAASNPGIVLPDLPITTVHRSDGSGTTFAFTNHLSAISKDWAKGPGTGKSVVWPGGLGARGNAGVAALVDQTPGAVGYLEYGYAELAHLPTAVLENRAGKFIEPGPESGKAALEGGKLPANLRLFIPDPAGPNAYPIVTYTWLLCYTKYQDRRAVRALKDVLRFCLTEGQQFSDQLGYIPLPEAVRTTVLAEVEKIEP